VHVELNATDVDKAKGFYGKLFGWKLEDVPMEKMTYTMIGVGEGTGGGMMKQPMPGVASVWIACWSMTSSRQRKAMSLSYNGSAQ
jgi:predicted enzyme related to lactoylglutathione lyase